MPILVSFDLRDDQAQALGDHGALDPDQVWYEYLTQDDARVRPSHRALHGSVWRAGDPEAPVPPISWGCRCFLSYRARPESAAARVLPVAEAVPLPKAAIFASYLDDTVPAWRDALSAAAKAPAGDRLSILVDELRRRDPRLTLTLAREFAMMATEAAKSAPAQG